MADELFFGRGTDHLGNLSKTLRDLMGFSTLAHELIQNADDPENATSMQFDVRSDEIVVDNDGRFSDCGRLEAPTCLWKTPSEPKKMCDFHGFRLVASEHKRVERNTAGAFGIGFTAVYQMTDRPELISAGRHWILDELQDEAKRIRQCPGCVRCRDESLPGTRFILPWAMEESEMRSRLGVVAVDSTAPQLFLDKLQEAIPSAMPFLKRLERISILRDGQVQSCFERSQVLDIVMVTTDGTSTHNWLIVSSDFDQSASKLRSAHIGKIEDKRSPKVELAIPTDEIINGYFYAFLPTQDQTGLPFYINADFFPRSDRKGIVFGDDIQSVWNNLAITAAAEAFSTHLELIRDRVSPCHLWNLIEAVLRSTSKNAHLRKALEGFPECLKKCIQLKNVVESSLGHWVVPADAVFLNDDEELEALPVLEGLGLNVVHGDLRFAKERLLGPIVGVKVLDSERLATALQSCGLNRRVETKQLPECLQSDGSMELLWNEVARLFDREADKDKARRQFRLCAIAPARDGAYWPCQDVYQSHEETIASFSGILPKVLYLTSKAESVEALKKLCPWFTITFAIDRLVQLPKEAIPNAIAKKTLDPRRILGWMIANQEYFVNDKERQGRLAALPIFPTATGTKPLTVLSLPGDFTLDLDPLGVADLVEVDVLDGDREFFQLLNATELTFKKYIVENVRSELVRGSLTPDKKRALISFMAENLEGLKKLDNATRSFLSEATLIECADGTFRKAEEVYFPTDEVKTLLGSAVSYTSVAVDEKDKASLFYKWLGVATQPRLEDIGYRIRTMKAKPPTAEAVALIPAILTYFDGKLDKEDLAKLNEWAWLPARGNRERWFRPKELFTDKEAHLFESQASFLDIPAATRDKISNLLIALEIEKPPSVGHVVRHLLECAKQKTRVTTKVYDWLNARIGNPELDQLVGQCCILLPDGNYVRPTQVFWQPSPFGRFRFQLPSEWRKHDPLYRRLSVREVPNTADAVAVLCEIAAESGSAEHKLDEPTQHINMACWKMLEAALASAQITSAGLSRLGKLKSVCTSDGMLQPPERVFFDDRTGLAAKFVGFPRNNVIGPAQVKGVWRALEAAGVRRLSRMVETRLVETVDPFPNEAIHRHLQNLKHPLARVVDVYKSDSSDASGAKQTLDVIDGLNYLEVRRLVVRDTIEVDSETWESKPENSHAQFIATEKTLYFTLLGRKQTPHWPAIARELASLLAPDNEPGLLSGAINTVIDSDSAEAANGKLDEFDYPDFGFEEHEAPVATSTVIQDLGDASSPASQESTESVTTIPDGKRVAGTGESSVSPTPINEPQAFYQSDAATPVDSSDTSEQSQPQNRQTTEKPPSTTSTKASTDNPRNAESRHADEGRGETRDVVGTGNHWSARQRDASDDDDDFDADPENEGDADDKPSTQHSAGRSRQERQRDGIRRGYSNLKSYVMPDRLEEDVVADPKGHATRTAVGRAGVARVLEFERRQGRIPQEMPANHPGFDVKSQNKNGEVERYIEVKSFAGDWDRTAAGLTQTEFKRAVGLQDRYWLYVVERAQSDKPRIHRIKNPAGKVNRFMFDDGWKQVAE